MQECLILKEITMKLRDYDGRVIRIIEAIPMIEHRFMFNGSMRRLLEPCKVGIKANAIVFARDPADLFAYDDYTHILVGNIKGGAVESLLTALIEKDFLDISGVPYQQERECIMDYVLDGKYPYYAKITSIYDNTASITYEVAKHKTRDALEELAGFTDEELRKTIYDLTDFSMLELGLMSREELEEAYDNIEIQTEEDEDE